MNTMQTMHTFGLEHSRWATETCRENEIEPQERLIIGGTVATIQSGICAAGRVKRSWRWNALTQLISPATTKVFGAGYLAPCIGGQTAFLADTFLQCLASGGFTHGPWGTEFCLQISRSLISGTVHLTWYERYVPQGVPWLQPVPGHRGTSSG